MREGMLHIRDVEGSKKTVSVETRLEAMEQQVFKCQGMMERGLNANHMMITEFTNKHRIDANDIGKHLSTLYDRVDQLQGETDDLQNQNCEYEYRYKSIRCYARHILQSLHVWMDERREAAPLGAVVASTDGRTGMDDVDFSREDGNLNTVAHSIVQTAKQLGVNKARIYRYKMGLYLNYTRD
ncbi:40s ribosomal protein s5-1 [Hordeum vulgare]|nr:40s ribosomal protein s5-1 [Hordeum vulgare]